MVAIAGTCGVTFAFARALGSLVYRCSSDRHEAGLPEQQYTFERAWPLHIPCNVSRCSPIIVTSPKIYN
jgi:hypothetical protein